jgi:hypothetical protein
MGLFYGNKERKQHQTKKYLLMGIFSLDIESKIQKFISQAHRNAQVRFKMTFAALLVILKKLVTEKSHFISLDFSHSLHSV